MQFDTLHTLGITTEQGQAIIQALDSHIRRMKRDLKHRERKTDTNGDMATAARICESINNRKIRIKNAENLREIIQRSMEAV